MAFDIYKKSSRNYCNIFLCVSFCKKMQTNIYVNLGHWAVFSETWTIPNKFCQCNLLAEDPWKSHQISLGIALVYEWCTFQIWMLTCILMSIYQNKTIYFLVTKAIYFVAILQKKTCEVMTTILKVSFVIYTSSQNLSGYFGLTTIMTCKRFTDIE